MYQLLHEFFQRPEPFSRSTVKELWTRPHLARQMLNYHLDQSTELASRRFETIDKVVDWLDRQLKLPTKTLCDLGCGPGLYTRRFAELGAEVTGIDFSVQSLAHARKAAEQSHQAIRYLEADYLSDALPMGFDVVTLVYYDLCALSPHQRAILLRRMHDMLVPGGQVVLDVAGLGSFARKAESSLIEERLMNGFWAPGEYVGIQRTFVYAESQLSLDRYLIIEPEESWQIFNWLQYYSPQRLRSELEGSGFEVEHIAGSLTGEPLTPESDAIAVIARKP